jgi:hypothetical protein
MPDGLETAPIVLYGAARSGTTYLAQILNRQPEVFITNETRVFVWAHEALKRAPVDERIVYREKDAFVAHLRERLPGLIRDFHARMHPNRPFWGDKNPHYAAPENKGCLETIRELFPGAKFIHIIRDGRDVVASGLRGVWTDFETVHRMWQSHVQIGTEFGRALPRDRYFEVRYEDLVADDVGVARDLVRFLGLVPHDDVIRFCEAQRAERTPYCAPARDLSRGADSSDWVSLLSPGQRVRSLELLGDGLIRFRYETRESLGSKLAVARAAGLDARSVETAPSSTAAER